MTAPTRLIRNDSAWLLLKAGTRQKMRGVMLLYPDKLAGVPVALEYLGIMLGGLIAGLAYPWGSFTWALVLIAGLWLGGAIGRAVDRRQAIKAIGDPEAATIIPLDTIVSLRTEMSARLGGFVAPTETLVVTTAEGTEYGFRVRGRTGDMQAGIASALARLG